MAPTSTPEQVLAALARIERKIDALRAPLSAEDLATLQPLFAAVRRELQSTPWAIADLLEMFPALLRRRSAKSLSKLVEKSEGRDVDGHTVERVGLDNGRLVWRLVEVVPVCTTLAASSEAAD